MIDWKTIGKFLNQWYHMTRQKFCADSFPNEKKCIQERSSGTNFHVYILYFSRSIWNEFTRVTTSKSWNSTSRFVIRRVQFFVEELQKDLSWSHFFVIRENFFPSFRTKFHNFTWYHWLRKFPIDSQPIIIQNYDV